MEVEYAEKTKIIKGYSVIINGVKWNFYPTIDESFGALLLALTGNMLFNKIMRKHAKSLGYKLNQYGVMAGKDIVAGRTENQIFYMLGVNYVKPMDRCIHTGYELSLIKEE